MKYAVVFKQLLYTSAHLVIPCSLNVLTHPEDISALLNFMGERIQCGFPQLK